MAGKPAVLLGIQHFRLLGLLDALGPAGSASRALLAALLKLSQADVAKLLADLARLGLAAVGGAPALASEALQQPPVARRTTPAAYCQGCGNVHRRAAHSKGPGRRAAPRRRRQA
jgi:hypothetical protein